MPVGNLALYLYMAKKITTTRQAKSDAFQRYLRIHSTVALKAPSLPASTSCHTSSPPPLTFPKKEIHVTLLKFMYTIPFVDSKIHSTHPFVNSKIYSTLDFMINSDTTTATKKISRTTCNRTLPLTSQSKTCAKCQECNWLAQEAARTQKKEKAQPFMEARESLKT